MGTKFADSVFVLVAEVKNEISDTYSKEDRNDEVSSGHLMKR
jgi:hypothetical protein